MLFHGNNFFKISLLLKHFTEKSRGKLFAPESALIVNEMSFRRELLRFYNRDKIDFLKQYVFFNVDLQQAFLCF